MKNLYLLDKIKNWDDEAVKHVLSRTLYGFTNEEIDFASSLSMDEFIDNYLLSEPSSPNPPGDWVSENPRFGDPIQNNSWLQELIDWWVDIMLGQGYSFREKMVLFWHNHFVSEYLTVKIPQFMYIQNALFREHAFGNIIDLTKKVTVDPAMLIYLNGRENTKTKPNENYARELMELFTIGIGNYTENDIKEAARALTGWKINGLNSVFTPFLFDDGEKTFLGETGNFNHEDIIDIIFSREETSKFISQKLYKEFIHYEPNEEFVDQLSYVMRENNYEIKSVLSTLLKSTFFHNEEIRGAKIKSPVEFTLGSLKQFLITSFDHRYIQQALYALQQVLFNPPDVRGWEGQRKWISTNTYPLRNQFTDSIITGKRYPRGNLNFKVDTLTFARSFPSSEDAVQFIEDTVSYFIGFPLSNQKKEWLLEVLLDGAEIYDWSTYSVYAEQRLENYFITLARLPEFQLS